MLMQSLRFARLPLKNLPAASVFSTWYRFVAIPCGCSRFAAKSRNEKLPQRFVQCRNKRLK